MSIEKLSLKNPGLAEQIRRFAEIMDGNGQRDADIVLYAPRFKEARASGVTHFGAHKLVKGPPTFRRQKRPPDIPMEGL